MKEIKVGLIGCGGMATAYRELYNKFEGVKLDFIVGLESDNPENLAKELGCSGWSYDYMDCINSDVDIIDISTPNHLHCEQFKAAVKMGKHILLQKPVAASEKDAVEILLESKKTDKKVGMFMARHSGPAFCEIRNMVQSGVIGKVSSVRTRSGFVREAPPSDQPADWRSSLEKTGGGTLIQLGIHDYDALSWILGEKITKVAAFCDNLMSPHIGGDDASQTIVKFENGIVGCVEASYCATGARFEIYGNEGFISFNENRFFVVKAKNKYNGDYVNYEGNDTYQQYEIPCYNKTIFKTDNPYEQHIAFINSVRNNTPVPVTIEEGFYDFVIVKAAYEASKTGKTVDIEEFKDAMLKKWGE